MSGSLAGRTDCWWHVAIFSDFENRFYAWMHGLTVTSSFYPYKFPWLFGEPGFGVAALYVLVHAIVPDYIWAYYLVIVLLFSITAFAFYVLAGEYISSRFSRFAGGLFFSAANFSLGELDHHNAFFWGIALLSIFSMQRFISSRRVGFLWLSFALLGLQIYFSTTIFIYLFFCLAIFIIAYYKVWVENHFWLHFLGGALTCLALVLPFYVLFANSIDVRQAYDPAISAHGYTKSNLWLADYFRFLPGNIFYPRLKDIDFELLYNIKCVSPGIVLLALCLLGFRSLPHKAFFSLLIAGFILALGSELRLGNFIIPMPMALYYHYLPDAPFFLTPIRAYFMVHLVVCMAAALGLSGLLLRFPGRIWLGVAVVLLFLIENTPINLPSAPAREAINEGKRISAVLSKEKEGNVLHLPSQILPTFPIETNALQMNVFSREFYYILLQTMYQKNCMNGADRLIPKERIGFNRIFQLNSRDSFEVLLRKYDIQYVAFHDDLALSGEHRLIDSLSHYPFLKYQTKVGNCSIFKLN